MAEDSQSLPLGRFRGLKDFLDFKVEQYNQPNFIANDPICIPHQYTLKQDIEIAAFFAAILAWGQRKTIINKCNELFLRMDNQPYQFMLNHSDGDLKRLLGFKHRTFNDTDLLYFVAFKSNSFNFLVSSTAVNQSVCLRLINPNLLPTLSTCTSQGQINSEDGIVFQIPKSTPQLSLRTIHLKNIFKRLQVDFCNGDEICLKVLLGKSGKLKK
jgi:hypothetical protein